jgi:hypothetical protein
MTTNDDDSIRTNRHVVNGRLGSRVEIARAVATERARLTAHE